MPAEGAALIGGMPVETLRCVPSTGDRRPGFASADVVPGRGMLLAQAGLRLTDGREVGLLAVPPVVPGLGTLDGGPADFAGNASFGLGAALLIPYANRIRGRSGPVRTLETQVLGETVRLPRNWGGKAPGAEQYAMHGLILDRPVDRLERPTSQRIEAVIDAGDFGGHWLSRTELRIAVTLQPLALELEVVAANVGTETLPIGFGWHPYFALPSGRREQARVRLPARRRLEVNDYDEVLPTGRVLGVAGTAYDFTSPDGAALGEGYFDDCFVDLEKAPDGSTVCEIMDPAAGYGLRVTSPTPQVNAIQLYAPPDKPFVVLEPVTNWPDPFGAEWGPDAETGMTRLEPGQTTAYRVRVEPFGL